MKEVSLAKAYDPAQVESKWYKVWEEQGYFHASATTPKTPFTIVIPPPNVTGSLHMGHAMYVVQDVLTRWRRMQGYNALWLPGTDHAGIATQLVVERMLMKEEGKSRHDLGREEFTSRVWQWKEKYGSRIIEQLRVLGFSLDWQRCRFTMDEGLSRAVLEAFVRLYEDGLIYRARRLINWCTRCYTALSDLEVEAEETDGKLWHIAYPVVGSTERLVVATTRPETLLGDTAVAVHPEDPRFAHLIGKQLQVPLTDRTIPVVADPVLVSMEFGTGAVKVTPGHDFNDFETGLRHNLEQISVFDLTGKLNDNAPERFRGLTIADARKAVLEALTEAGLLVGGVCGLVALGLDDEDVLLDLDVDVLGGDARELRVDLVGLGALVDVDGRAQVAVIDGRHATAGGDGAVEVGEGVEDGQHGVALHGRAGLAQPVQGVVDE